MVSTLMLRGAAHVQVQPVMAAVAIVGSQLAPANESKHL